MVRPASWTAARLSAGSEPRSPATVGASVEIPDDARVVDATGYTLAPSFVDAAHELELDFGEEDVEFADRDGYRRHVTSLLARIDELVRGFSTGRAIAEGVPVAILGAPNRGKSTLLNAILREDRAIVSDTPGTTRDTLEEVLTLEGIRFRFIDTAGLRDTADGETS